MSKEKEKVEEGKEWRESIGAGERGGMEEGVWVEEDNQWRWESKDEEVEEKMEGAG